MIYSNYIVNEEIPIIKDVDVVVIGSGPGGIGAAVTAARNGAKTVLVERYGFPGGMATAGEVHPFMPNHHGEECMDKPIYSEWVDSMRKYIPCEDCERAIDEPRTRLEVSKEAAILGAEDLLLEAGVEILYHHFLVDCTVEDRRIDNAILSSKSGYVGVKAKYFIDCSGDADLAAKAGCEIEIGDENEECQPMTTCFKLSNIGEPRAINDNRQHVMDGGELSKIMTKKYLEAVERGEIDCPRENILAFKCFEKDIVHFNTTRVIKKSAINGEDLSEAEIIARRQIRQIVAMLKREIPEFKNARYYSMATQIGVRETRRVRGRDYLVREDFSNRSKFEDGIARCNYPIDIHSPYGKGTEIEHMDRNEFYEIPYGCIIANDIDNLFVGGRPISVDVAIHSSARVMPPAVSIGQAAGMAVAMSISEGKDPFQLDGKKVRSKLVEFGAYL